MITIPGKSELLFIVAMLIGSSAAALAIEPDFGAINSMDRTSFVQKFGGIFEKSPWVAEKAWSNRPFANTSELHAAMVNVVRHAPIQDQLALLKNHPDLAGKEAAEGVMTASSTSEQASVSINTLSKSEFAEISELNAAYKQRFGFPFIIAVRLYSKEGIFFEFRRRLQNDTPAEFENDLRNVFAITRLRLEKMLEGS